MAVSGQFLVAAVKLRFVPPAEQLRFALAILLHSWALRSAIHQSATTHIEESAMSTHPTIPLTCRLHLRHHWERRQTEDGSLFTACARCGKEHAPTGRGIDWIGN